MYFFPGWHEILQGLSDRSLKDREKREKKKGLSSETNGEILFILYIDPLVSSKRLTMNKLVSRKLSSEQSNQLRRISVEELVKTKRGMEFG